MKRIFIFLQFTFFAITLSAQTPSWAWAGNAGGTAEVESRAATADTSGNLYVAGRYDLGYAIFGSDTLFNSGNSDLFFAKYDPAGNLVWSMRAGGSGSDRANALITDKTGNIYLAGFFSSSYLVLKSDTLWNPGGPPMADWFLAKFDPNGNILWATSGSDTNQWDEADIIGMDPLGNVYLGGTYFGVKPVYGTDTLYNNNPGTSDMFLAKFDPSGNMLWARSAGGNSWDFAESMTCSLTGDIYVAGNFMSTNLFVGTHTVVNSSPGKEEIFLAKYDMSGNVLWVKNMPGDSADFGAHVTTDPLGNIYLASNFSGDSLNFGGNVTAYNTSAPSSIYHHDIAFTKFDANGNALWVRTASGSDNEETKSIAADPDGNVYVAGYFKGDSMVVGSTTLYPVGGYDIFIIKYDTAGNMQWAISAGGSGSEQWPHIATHGGMLWSTGGKMQAGMGSLYVSGYFDSPSITFGSDQATSSGSNNMFVAKLGTSPTTAVQSIDNNMAVSVYPNPGSGKFLVQTAGASNVAVYNAIGTKILEKNVNKYSGPLELDLSGYAGGIYFVKVSSGAESVTRKVIVDKE